MNLPLEYLNNMKKLLYDDYDAYINSLEQDYKSGIRANLIKTNPQELKELLETTLGQADLQSIKFKNIPWCDTGYYYDNKKYKPSKNFYYSAGLFYIQEPSAMSVGAVLPIDHGDKVLDLCAAPGGKTTHIASKLNGSGLIISNDISTTRCKAIVKNIELQGITNAIILNEKPSKLATKFENYFDKIVIDAPCSGEGMFRKDKESIKNWQPNTPQMYHTIQMEILESAKEMLKSGGIIAYSTCTYSPIENEETILKFLENNSDFELIEFDKSCNFENARPNWISKDLLEKSNQKNIDSLIKAGRLMPHKVEGEGHFLALLIKKDNINNNNNINKISKIKPVNKKELVDFYKFIEENINIKNINNNNTNNFLENLYIHNSSLFSIPDGINLDKLRVVKSGFYLGELKKNRFEPSQAFAMGIKPQDFKNTLVFNINDENLLRYFKGESFIINNNLDNNILKDGWCLVCIEKYPVGFGKIQKGRLKNKYCVGWKL